MTARKYVDPVEAERLYHEHKDVTAVAEHFGVSRSKIQRVLRGKLVYGRRLARPNARKFDRKEALRLYQEHGSTIPVARILGVHRSTVQRALRGKMKSRGTGNPVTHEIMLSLWRSGKCDRDIAIGYHEVTGRKITRDASRHWRDRNGLPFNPQSGPGNRAGHAPMNKGQRKYDWTLGERLLNEGRDVEYVSRALGCDKDYVYKMRKDLGFPPLHPSAYLPPFEGRLAKAEKLLREEGVSIAEAARTAQVSPKTLYRRFPQYAWTHKQSLEYALEVRYGEQRINKVWNNAAANQRLTKPPLTQ